MPDKRGKGIQAVSRVAERRKRAEPGGLATLLYHGIRMALGAERRRILWMVLREVVALCGCGLAVGLGIAYETTEFVKSLLFGLKPNDPWTLGVSVSILIACAVLAGYLPAWRASRIDPVATLRHE
jgi:ABC-type antimicrobial peptide transport system permease subunit